jgi:hypothetical protein
MPAEFPSLFTRVLNEQSRRAGSPPDEPAAADPPPPDYDRLSDEDLVRMLDWASRSSRVRRLGYRVHRPEDVVAQTRRLRELQAVIQAMGKAHSGRLEKLGRPKDPLTNSLLVIAACLHEAKVGS